VHLSVPLLDDARLRPCVGLNDELSFRRAHQVGGDATKAVATHLGTAAVRVEDDHRGSRLGAVDPKDAVCADAAPSVTDAPDLIERRPALDDDEVVSETFPFLEGALA